MAPVYDFRHVELDKIGRGKKIVKPPGGESHDIFGTQDGGGSPNSPELLLTPRKTNNYMQSSIFTPDSTDSAPPTPNGHTPTTPTAKLVDTQARLFGESSPSGDEGTPRRVVNRQRSSIFEQETVSPKTTPVRRPGINPITGVSSTPNGCTNGYHKQNGVNGVNGTNGINGVNGTNGVNGLNGHSNGYSSPGSPMNGTSPRVRNPPGGKSSGIF